MRAFKSAVLVTVLAIALGAAVVIAASPHLLNFQGQLTDPAGAPRNGSYPMTFRIYSASAGGVAIWTESQTVDVANGLFKVLLGSVTPLVDSVFKDSSRYLGVQVASDIELSPRSRLVSSPWAFRVGSLDGASGHSLQLIGSGSDTVQLLPNDSVVLRSTDAAGIERVTIKMPQVGNAILTLGNPLGEKVVLGGDSSAIKVYDAFGRVRVDLGRVYGTDGGGAISFLAPSVTKFGLSGALDANAGTTPLVVIGQDSVGRGRVSTYDLSGQQITRISSSRGGVGYSGAMTVFWQNGKPVTQLISNIYGGGYVGVFDTVARPIAYIGSLYTGFASNGIFRVNDSTGYGKAAMYADYGNDGHIDLYSHSGPKKVEISNSSESPTVDGGFMKLYGTKGNEIVNVMHVTGDGNRGLIEIKDTLGVARAGIYVNATGQGIVWGTTKSFRMPNPLQVGTDIWYTCPEGPEAAAYIRGSGHLVNGTATVDLPSHFSTTISAQGITVQLTPLSANSDGLAVVQKSPYQLVIRELRNGTGTYDFDYVVMGVRKGFENYQVIRSNDEVRGASVNANKNKADAATAMPLDPSNR